jgi:hypothetical protein
MEETISYVDLQGWYDTDSVTVFKLPPTADPQLNTPWASLWFLQHCQDYSLFSIDSPWVNHFWQTHVRTVCPSIKLTSLRDAWDYFGIPTLRQLFLLNIVEDWRQNGSGLVLRYDQNVLCHSICIKLHNRLSYNHQTFHCPTSVARLQLD